MKWPRGLLSISVSTCSHLAPDFDRSNKHVSTCGIVRSISNIRRACESSRTAMSAASPSRWRELATPPTCAFNALDLKPEFMWTGDPSASRNGWRMVAARYVNLTSSERVGVDCRRGKLVAVSSSREKLGASFIFSMFSTCNQFRGVWRKVEAFER